MVIVTKINQDDPNPFLIGTSLDVVNTFQDQHGRLFLICKPPKYDFTHYIPADHTTFQGKTQ